MTSKELITELYIGYFDRAPDPVGLDFWIGVLDAEPEDGGLSIDAIAQDFATQSETKTAYPFLVTPPTPDMPATAAEVELFINAIYDNLFDRAPDADGFAFWSGVLQDGFSPGTFILAVIGGASADDRAVLDNKVEVGCAWVETAAAQDSFTLDDAYRDGSKAALGDVSADDATVDAGTQAAALFFQEAPSVELTGAPLTLAEDVDLTLRLKVADIVVTDDGIGTNVLALTGDDAGLFEIDGTELFLKAGAVVDFETNPALDVSVTVDDAGVGSTPDGTADLSIALTDVNEPPSVALNNVVTDLSEDADTTAAIKVADIVVTDDSVSVNILALTGDDADLFEIVGTELLLKAGAALDFESNSSLDVTVTVDDAAVGSSPDGTTSLTVAVTNVNETPTVSLSNEISTLSEDADTSAALKVADIVVADDGLGINDLALVGADAELFEIVGTELFLKAGAVLDFETNAVLDVTVEVDDGTVGSSPDDSASLSVTVTDVNDVPAVTLSGALTSLSEDTDTSAAVKVADIVVSDDGQGTNTLALTGVDAALFEIVGTELFLKAGTPLDFENVPSFDVAVTVDDATIGSSPDGTAPLSISVTDVNEAPSIGLINTVSLILETDDTTTRIKVADIVLTDDALGTTSLALTGADAGLFEIDGTELFLKAGTVLNFETNPTLDVSVTADDAELGGNPDAVINLLIAVTDINGAPEVALVNVSSSFAEDLDITGPVKVADIVVTDDVAGTNTLALAGADAALFEINGAELFLKAGTVLDFESNPALDVSVTVDDVALGAGVDDTAAASIAVTNVNEAPSVSLTLAVTTLSESASTAVRTKVADVVVTDDALGTNALALTGADAGLFEIDGTELFLKAGTVLNFEVAPLLNVVVTVDDALIGVTPDGMAPLALPITNVNETPSLALSGGLTDMFEGTDTTNRVQVATIVLSDDGTGTNTLALTGTDAGLFEIVGSGLFLKAGTVLDVDTNPTLDVSVTVDDATISGTPDDTATLSVAVTPGAPGAASATTESLTFVGNASSAVRFGQIEVADADPGTPGDQPGFVLNTNADGDPYAGVAGEVLSLIDTTGHDGLVSLGVIADIDGAGLNAGDAGFLLDNSGSAGDVVACLGEADVFGVLVIPELSATGEWTFDNSGAAGTMEISLKALDLNAGGLLTFLNVDIMISGDIDLSVLGDDLTIDAASTLEIAEGGTLTLTVEQVDDLEDAGVVIFGAGSVVVTGESGDDGTVATDEINTDFAILQTATVDLSAVTLAAADSDGAVDITVSGAASDAVGTDLVVDGDRVAQTVIGTGVNDAVMVSSSAADGDLTSLDVILRLGADGGDIGDPLDTPIGTVDPTEIVGDTIDLDSTFANVLIDADAGFDAVLGSGFSSRIDVQVASGAEFYAPVVASDYSASANSSNEGTGVLEAVGVLDRDISTAAAGGSEGWVLIGAAGSTGTTLIGESQNDTIVDGVPDDDDNNNEEDEFTGNGGSDAFVFRVTSSMPAAFEQTDVQAAADLEYITVTATPIVVDSGAALVTVEYQLNNVTTVAVVNDTNAGFDVDFADDASVASAIAAVMNSISGISASVDGGTPTQVNLSGDNGNLLNINSITANAAGGGAGLITTVDTADDGNGPADDATDTVDDDTQVTVIEITGIVTPGEVYFLTVMLSDGSEIEAQYEAMALDDADDVAAGLIGNGVTGLNDIAVGQVVAALGGAANIIELTDGDDDDGGFTVSLSLGQAVLGGAGSSSILTGAEVSLAVADVDIITDFVDDDDTISFGLAVGTSDNYDEAAHEADFADALGAANTAFAGDADLVYFLTGSDADSTGLLFVNATDNGSADFLVQMTGITEANFDDSNIV